MQFEMLRWCSGVSLALMCLPSDFAMWRFEDVTLLRLKGSTSSTRTRWLFKPLGQNLVLSLRLVSSSSRPVLFFGEPTVATALFRSRVCISDVMTQKCSYGRSPVIYTHVIEAGTPYKQTAASNVKGGAK